ncbi:UDP-2,3-diacylglucosamine diphosphatase [Adhaeribacter pallidiroseus]|uniref:UDP-2,3-diacylglucosamine diphosphatase n=1 Tax=Adhaeribacter pallidiroseus TaxID=2072847 RepID=A0A369QLT5_9BACT|nr:UDP-2,3-diacylglucosamine diphosphatase [Adhaeribacter pallidiroseus]RDC65332.1 UDP-2,3-diacylglucosamine diphosphatase [Adhaeribacter pallidiroseus]
MGLKKRPVEVVVISDVHLGTYGCHAKELLRYLKSIKPKKIILNGDIIDIWQFSKSYWPKAHMQVVKYLTGLIAKGVKVQYITGNHDEMLRKFVGFKMGSFTIQNKLLLELDGRQAWIFHGDVFDVTMQHSRWLAKLGAAGYDLLILINRFVNFFSVKLNGNKISLSRSIKNRVKSAVAFINNFEETAANIAIDNGYDYVVCGHIHQPEIKAITTEAGSVTYLNSGDWIENLTALEYYGGQWHLYRYHDDATMAHPEELPDTASEVLNYPELMQNLMQEFKLKGA